MINLTCFSSDPPDELFEALSAYISTDFCWKFDTRKGSLGWVSCEVGGEVIVLRLNPQLRPHDRGEHHFAQWIWGKGPTALDDQLFSFPDTEN